ncbi:MAG TPA: DedA family protein [Pyrinomonadaceae bacterium]|nr:DedA family protein [Pyrinomonadaceae bacterium]
MVEIPFSIEEVIREYGIYAVFALCTVEGDITLLISGTLAHGGYFDQHQSPLYSFIRVLLFGTAGGMVGDMVSYVAGRTFRKTVEHYSFYLMAKPRIERLIDKFGNYAIVISKYIYGIRVAMCLFYGVARMPFWRFVWLDAISCGLWVLLLSGAGYFFSGAVTSIIGDFQQIGIALFFIVMTGIVVFYVVERYWLSEKVEEANPETIQKIEEKILAVEGAAEQKLHTIGERLHLTRDTTPPETQAEPPPETKKAAQK